MSHEATIQQIIDKVPLLTEEQVIALNSTAVPVDVLLSAYQVKGVIEETALQIGQLGGEVDPGVWSIARVAIAGVLANGKESVDSSSLIALWTDVVGDFHTDTLVETEESEVFDVENGLVQDPLPVAVEPVIEPVVEVVPVETPITEVPPVVEPVVAEVVI